MMLLSIQKLVTLSQFYKRENNSTDSISKFHQTPVLSNFSHLIHNATWTPSNQPNIHIETAQLEF